MTNHSSFSPYLARAWKDWAVTEQRVYSGMILVQLRRKATEEKQQTNKNENGYNSGH